MAKSIKCLLCTDTNQILPELYEKHGEDCVSHLHEEFAFALFDTTNNTYFAARDPVGLSPLYYTRHEGQYFFSHDIENLFIQSGITKEANLLAMQGILRSSTIPYTETMYREIKRLPPGHYMKVSNTGECTFVRYWKPETIEIDYSIDKEQAIKKFQQLFNQAIYNRIDDPSTTACELSGGLDSSSIVSWIKHKDPGYHLNCLAMAFDSMEACNEADYLNEVKKAYDINLIKIQTDTLDYKNEFDLDYNYNINPHWPIFVTHTMGFPLINKAHEMGIKTVLTGQGGDHVMAGNPYALHDYFRQFRWKLLLQELKASDSPLPLIKRFILFPLLGQKGLQIVLKILHPFRRKSSHSARKPDAWFEEFSELYTGNSLSFKYDLTQVVISHNSALFENSYYQVAEKQFGIKFKHPFFDRRLIEFMLSLPPNLKLEKGVYKFLLRQAMKGILPEKVRQRKSKAIFNDVIKQQISAINLDTLFCNAYIVKLGLIEQFELDDMKRKYQAEEPVNLIRFWQTLNVEYWYRFNFVNTETRSHP